MYYSLHVHYLADACGLRCHSQLIALQQILQDLPKDAVWICSLAVL